jgi:hypothetical protein
VLGRINVPRLGAGRPLGPQEMPYRRALAGTDVHDVDVLIRNPGLPGGRILSVSSIALADEDAGRYAVSAFHDVTAERRHRDELASFVGAVAHDLQPSGDGRDVGPPVGGISAGIAWLRGSAQFFGAATSRTSTTRASASCPYRPVLRSR